MTTGYGAAKGTPIAVGGIGGSGTRVVAAILEAFGIFIGDNLNKSKDNLDFPGLARFNPSNPERVARCIGHEEIVAFERQMLHGFRRHQSTCRGWGWKVPPTFLFLDYLGRYFDGLRYVHVIRHGLDMAFSQNRNQLRKWGHLFGIGEEALPPQRAALQYWIKANDFAISQASRYLSDRFVILNFDDLCCHPKETIALLLRFLENGDEVSEVEALASLVRPPPSMGRYTERISEHLFSNQELSDVERFGFHVDR